MKIVGVVGARPQFIKASVVSRCVRGHAHEVLVHTGQHYDFRMSEAFFQDLAIPKPDYDLGVGSGPHGRQTGEMLAGIERVLVDETPQLVVVYGDTNSTLAGALAAAKLSIPVAHVEAGLRSFNRAMPEEINRVMTDHLAALLFAPTSTAVENLRAEAITAGAYLVGDVMYDALLAAKELAGRRVEKLCDEIGVEPKGYVLATVHRAGNTDDRTKLEGIMRGLDGAGLAVVLPVHPRTRKVIDDGCVAIPGNVRLIEPLGYVDVIAAEMGAAVVATDSGGMQKEAYWLGVPCVTFRDETEWVETVNAGWNILVGAEPHKIAEALTGFRPAGPRPDVFGSGRAGELTAEHVAGWLARYAGGREPAEGVET